MAGTAAHTEECEQLLERLEEATQRMVALEDLVTALKRRVAGPDLPAIHLGVRHLTEALLRHAARAEGAEIGSGPDGTLNRLKDVLQPKLKDRVDGEFWRQVDAIQRVVNAHTHYQGDDVYHASSLRRSNPWDEILQVLRGVAMLAEHFGHLWPPPAGASSSKARPPVVRETVQESVRPSTRGARSSNKVDYADWTVAQARESDEVRAWLVENSGMQQQGVSRRLNANHGASKLRNVFDLSTESAQRAESPADDDLTYEEIGNLTIKQAWELELGADIAMLAGLTETTVNRKLRELHGRGVVWRQFDWYNPVTIGELTVHTALRYDMSPLLARVFDRSRASVLAALRDTPGQTKLRTVFPELDG